MSVINKLGNEFFWKLTDKNLHITSTMCKNLTLFGWEIAEL